MPNITGGLKAILEATKPLANEGRAAFLKLKESQLDPQKEIIDAIQARDLQAHLDKGRSLQTYKHPEEQAAEINAAIANISPKKFKKGGKVGHENEYVKKAGDISRKSQQWAAGLVPGLQSVITDANQPYYPRDTDHNGAGDAMRHLLLQAGLVDKYGEVPAGLIGWLHEMSSPGQPDAEYDMDAHNDGLGRQLGGLGLTKEELVKRAKALVDSGAATTIPQGEDGYKDGGGVDTDKANFRLSEPQDNSIAAIIQQIKDIGNPNIMKRTDDTTLADAKDIALASVTSLGENLPELLKLYHGGRKFDKWDPKMIGMGEGGGRRSNLSLANGPGLYAGDTPLLAKMFLKYGGENPALSKLLVDDTNIIYTNKKLSEEMAEKVKEASSRMDKLGMGATRNGLQAAFLSGVPYDRQVVRDILVDSGIDGVKQNLHNVFGHEYALYNPDIIKAIEQVDPTKFKDGGGVSVLDQVKQLFDPEYMKQIEDTTLADTKDIGMASITGAGREGTLALVQKMKLKEAIRQQIEAADLAAYVAKRGNSRYYIAPEDQMARIAAEWAKQGL